MPNLPSHFDLALETAAQLKGPLLERYLGSFLLGCTTPDIRAVTKWKRDHTHFAPLQIEMVGTGVAKLFEVNPHLTDTLRLNEATRAFLAGYITHLAMDEVWITHVYQPYFGNGALSPNPMQANIWDRALQLDMDRLAGEKFGDMAPIISALEKSDWGVNIGFIDADVLSQWRQWVAEFSQRRFSWDRLYFMARRMYKDDAQASALVDRFLSDMPRSLEGVYQKLPSDSIKDFQEASLRQSLRLIKEYLDVA